MKIIELPLCGLKVSRFIFGTASLFNVNVARPKKRQNLLAAAVDAGFSHFDTAPSYGFGWAERDLAPILKAHPDVSFTSKVGIYSPGGENQGNISVFLRKAAGRIIPAISRFTIDFSLSRAKDALEGSLKRTGRDTIDLYTLHEPELPLLQVDEWKRWLEDCKSSGKVREFGFALTADQLAPFLERDIMIGNIIQLIDSLEDREADILAQYGKPMQITYG
ncbi:MAG: aldo/keto reductase, partial [Thioalkalispiraceae bacterium]